MPIYSIQGPDGKTYEIEGPAGATKAQVVAAIQAKMRAPEPAPAVEAPQPTLAPSTQRTWGEATKDIGASVIGGLGSLLQVPGQLTQLVPGLQGVGQTLAKPGEFLEETGEGLKSQGLKVREALRSKAITEAEKDGVLSSFATAITETIKDPALLSTFITGQLPQLLGPAAAAKVGKAVVLSRSGLEGAELAAQAGKIGTRSAIGAGAAMQGADISSDAYKQALEAAQKQRMSEEDANAAALTAARKAFALATPISVLSQALPGGSAIERRLAGVAGKGRLKSAIGEAVSEAIEEGGGAFSTNVGVLGVDPTRELTQGVGAAAGLGTLGGGILGGILGKAPAPELPPELRPGETERQAAERIQAEILALKQSAQPPAPGPVLSTNNLFNLMAQPNGYGLVEQYKQRLKALPQQTPEVKQAIEEAEFAQRRSVIEAAERRTPKAVETREEDVAKPVAEPSGEGVPVAGKSDTGAAPEGVGAAVSSGVVPAVEDVGQPAAGEGQQPGAVAPTIEALQGSDTRLILPDGQKRSAKWEVIEADSVAAAMVEGRAQPRDRQRAASNAQVQSIANNPDFDRLSDTSQTMDYGAPTLTGDYVIVGGNGRFEGVNLSYNTEAGQSYKQNLVSNAQRFGLDPAQVSGMKKPILIRKIPSESAKPDDTRKLAIQSNIVAGLEMSDMERAALDSERMTNLQELDITDTGDIPLTTKNMGTIRDALKGYTKEELSGMLAADGSLSQSGLRRVKNAVLYKAYGKTDTLSRLLESPDADLKNVGTALMRASGSMSRLMDGIKSEAIPADYDIIEDLTGAVETLSALRASGTKVQDFINQSDMFGGGISNEAKAILTFLDQNLRSAKSITEFLNDYANAAITAEGAGDGLFGEVQLPSKQETIERAAQRPEAERAAAKSQQTIFEQPAGAPATEGAAKPEGEGRAPEGGDGAVVKKSLVEMRKRYEAGRAAPAPVETKPEPTEIDKAIEAKIEELGRVLSRILGRVGLKDVALNLVEDMKSEGEYSQSVIRLALDAASPVRALRHESIHALKELGFFTPQQWAALEKQAKSKWIDQYLKNVNINQEPLGEGEKPRYDAYSDLYKSQGLSDAAIEEAIIEEAIADAFGDFDVNKAPPGLMQAILKRLRDLFDGIRTAFGGEITAEQVFRKVERGELKGAAPAQAEVKPSLRGKYRIEKTYVEDYKGREKAAWNVVDAADGYVYDTFDLKRDAADWIEKTTSKDQEAKPSLRKPGEPITRENVLGAMKRAQEAQPYMNCQLCVQMATGVTNLRGLPKVKEAKIGDVYTFGETKDMAAHYAIEVGNGDIAEVEQWGERVRVIPLSEVVAEYGEPSAIRRPPETAYIAKVKPSLREVPLSTRGLMEVQPIVAMQELGLKTDAVRKPGGIELFNDVRSIALALNQDTIRNRGKIAKTDTSLTSEKELARAMADEIGYQLRATADTGTGKGWYSDNYPKAVKKLGKLYPELESDPYARTVFSALVAITSNGEKVSLNVKNAIKLYEDIRMGKDPRGIGSRRQNALDNNIEVVLQLMKQYGPTGMRNELLREITVKDMNAILRSRGEKADTSYLADTKVPAAALYFGPKLGAFFSNLEGAEGYLTMDMWWTRTVNRMRGQLESKATEASIKKFAQMMDKPNATRDEVVAATIPLRNKYEEFGWHTELEELVGKKEPAEDKDKPAWTLKAKRKAGPAYQALLFEHRLEKMANTIYKNEYELLKEAPFTPSDREFMYRTARRAQSLLKAEGINLSLADIQAALWYYEKRLYQHLSGRKADDIGYDEAITQLAGESSGPARPSVVFGGQPVSGTTPTGTGAAATGVSGKPAKPSLREAPNTPEFKRWSGGAPVIGLRQDHVFVSGRPVVVEALHGTTNADITEFKKSKANIESDFGAGFYSSNTPEDVAINYANVEGADLTRRIENLAKKIADNEEFDGDMDAATEEARKRLSQGAPNTMKLYMLFKNPAVLGGKGETFFDYTQSYNEETDEYGEPTGSLVDFINQLDEIGGGLDIGMRDIERAKEELIDEARDSEGLKFSQLAQIVKDRFSDAYSLEDGSAANGEALRQALEGMGFDGVIDTNAYAKFGPRMIRGAYSMIKTEGMSGLDKDTVHFIAFKPTQIKSATGNIGTFSPTSPDIRYSLRSATPADIRNRVLQTTVAREEKGFAQRITEAIAPESFSNFRAAALNRYNQLGVYDKKLAEKMGGAALLANNSAESAALLSDLGAGLTASALGVHDRMGGVPVYKNGVTTISNKNNTIKGPTAIFAPLAKFNDPIAYQEYQYWAGVKRGLRLLYTIDPKTGNAVERLFTEEDGPKAERLRQQYLKQGVDFDAIQKEWIKFNNGLVDYMVDTGVLSKERADIYKQYSDYLPFYRQMEGEETVGPKIFQAISGVKPPKKLKGSAASLDDFLETIVRNTQAAIQAGVKNVAAQRAADVAMKIQMARRLPYQSSSPNTFQVLEDGKVVTYMSTDMLFINAIKSLGLPDLPFIGMLSGPANLLRNLVTKDPGFMLANLMRDSMSAWVTSGVKMTPMVDTISNFGSALAGKDPAFQALMNAGILGGYEFSQNVEQSGREFAKALRKQAKVKAPGYKGILEMGAKPFTSLWEALEKGTTASDAATRMEVYKKTLAETGNEAEALYRALEVMNFNRKGSSAVIRILTAAVPFLNARMQGLDVLYRAATGKIVGEKAAEIQKQFFVRGATIAALSAAYWLLTHDDDEYKKQEQETRDNYWLLPSLGVKIPIPFEIGVLFKVIPERILAYTMGSDTGEDFLKSMFRQLTSTLAFNPIPQTALPVVEAMTNFSFFTMRPIVGQGLEGVQPAYQVGPGTSRLAEMIGSATKGLATELQISPMKLDNLINGYTGTMGMYLVNLMDAVYDMNTDSPKPSMRFERMPVIRRFALDPEARGSVTAYYELKNSVDAIVRTSNMLERTMNYEELPGYLQDNMRMLASKDYLLDLEKTMKEFREMKVMIRSSQMDADAKRDAILSIDQMENQMTSNIQYLKRLAKGG